MPFNSTDDTMRTNQRHMCPSLVAGVDVLHRPLAPGRLHRDRCAPATTTLEVPPSDMLCMADGLEALIR